MAIHCAELPVALDTNSASDCRVPSTQTSKLPRLLRAKTNQLCDLWQFDCRMLAQVKSPHVERAFSGDIPSRRWLGTRLERSSFERNQTPAKTRCRDANVAFAGRSPGD